MELIAITDEGLKYNIGTHVYIIIFHGETEAIIHGHSAEIGTINEFSSTREELIGILSVFYILDVHCDLWRYPHKPLQLEFIIHNKPALKIEKDPQKLTMNQIQ